MTVPVYQHFLSRPAQLMLILLASLLSIAGCDSTEPEEEPAGVGQLFVTNQGNFADANGTFSLVDVEAGSAQTMGQTLGTIIQSATAIGSRVYVMSNTANRIDIFDRQSLEQVGQITGVTSPRYMAQVSATKAYVTNLFKENFAGGTVTVVELGAGSVSSVIEVGDNPEGVVAIGSKAFVANHGFGNGSTISVVDVNTDVVVDTIEVDCDGPRWLEEVDGEVLLVVCTGKTLYDADWNVTGSSNGKLVQIDAATGNTLSLTENDGPLGTSGIGRDAWYDQETQAAYVIAESQVLRFDVIDGDINERIDIQGEAPLGAVAFDGTIGRLFVSRIPGYTEAGWVGLHDMDGSETGRIGVGVAPSHIIVLQ